MSSDVFLKESETGHVVLVDQHGEMISGQVSVVISQEVGEQTTAVVKFTLNPEKQMYKGGSL
jgi:hypothetical protein